MARISTRRAALAGATATAIAVIVAGAVSAEARCTRLAFSVNDYGKEGPIRDAKMLLDKHIASWAAERGIKKYTVGKKDVTCELFLDLIVFDEYTCRAEASVCWQGNQDPGPLEAGAVVEGPAKAAAKKAAAPKAAEAKPAAIQTGTVPAAAKASPVAAPAEPKKQ